MKGNIDGLLASPVSFLDDSEPGSIAISTRIRLARNLAGRPFPCGASPEEQQEITGQIKEAIRASGALDFDRELREFDIPELDMTDRQILFERRLASAEFIAKNSSNCLMVCPEERCSIMINEEDQLRMQSIRPGFQLDEVFQEINRIDDLIGAQLDYAFDEQTGFLTSCPTNAGTGMRASVMLHLPALVLSGQIGPTIQGINKLHLAVRGIFGEGSEYLGNFFQISNQSTLGESEEKIISNLKTVIEQLIRHEKNARQILLENDRFALMDFIGRSYGILRHSYKLSGQEALKSLSGVRLGVDLGLFNTLNTGKINELFIATGKAHLQKRSSAPLDENERDICRAALCREKLKQI